MKKLLLLLPVTFLLLSTQVDAKSENGKSDFGKSHNSKFQVESESDNNIEIQSENNEGEVEVEVEVEQECDENGEWKNHGQYVSCVAKLKLGGKVVSEAAQSDVGKKNHDTDDSEEDEDEVDPSITPSPSASPSPSISPSVSPSPSASPSPSVSVSPTGTDDEADQTELAEQIQNLIDMLTEFLNGLFE